MPPAIYSQDDELYATAGRTLGEAISALLGWTFVTAWSLSFYPQVILNYRRRSVQGLSIDFIALNIFGFTSYLIYNVALVASKEVRREYQQRHGHLPQAKGNDIAFAAHALILSLITFVQTRAYKRDSAQRVSRPALLFILTATILAVVLASIAGSESSLYQWLDVVYYVGYIKLAVSFGKYVPQAYINFKRKSTEGWSIGNILLDATGGILSLLQLILDSWMAEDWSAITGNPAKLGLSLLSLGFDSIFITQHYILYDKGNGQENAMTDPNVLEDHGDRVERRRLLEAEEDEAVDESRTAHANERAKAGSASVA